VYFLGSVAPIVSSPPTTDVEFEGSKENVKRFCLIFRCANRVSVTVGMTVVLSGLRVLNVKFLGPILRDPLFDADIAARYLCSP